MTNAEEDSMAVLEAIRRDSRLRVTARELRPDPPGQMRLFRGVLVDSAQSCVLKTDLGELESVWMPAVSNAAPDVVARVLGTGMLTTLDRRWMLLEDLPYRARSDRQPDVIGVMHATARFQQVAEDLDLPTYPIDTDFFTTYALQAIAAGCPGPTTSVLERIQSNDHWLRSLGGHVRTHGDVHFWNAVAPHPDGPWRLIDPIPRTAHWAWDAAYAQLTSGVQQTPDLIEILLTERQRLGMPVPGIDHLDQLRAVLLGLSALLWWAIQPARRVDPWWHDQVRRHVTTLASTKLPA